MFKHRRLLSQNFLWDRKLVKKLVELSSIGKNDLVLEIGPGDGIILEELIIRAGKVIGIEKDYDLLRELKQKYSNQTNLELYLGDALSFPHPRQEYKVFSNIPFAIEGILIRKFLNEQNPPADCFLIIRSDLAKRLTRRNTLFHSSHTPFFEISIFHNFRRQDFKPIPKVKATMIRFKKRKNPLLNFEERKKYHKFVRRIFETTLYPRQIDLEQWIKTYKSHRERP